jgi:hypothetical protein
MISLVSFIKKLIILDVIWGRRTKLLTGIKDGGAKATEIGDSNIAKEYDGNTIFNVNNPANCPLHGGHYHDPSSFVSDPTEICLNFNITDWVDNKITVIYSGIPTAGQIGPHLQNSTCMNIQTYQKVNIPSIGSFKEVDLQIIIDSATKNILLIKSAKPVEFAGKVFINAKV